MSLCCTLMAAAVLAYVRRAGLYLDTLTWTTFAYRIVAPSEDALTQRGSLRERTRRSKVMENTEEKC